MDQPAGTQSFRTFLIVWSGQLVSTLGSSLTSFAMGVWLYETTGSTTLFALSILIYVIPTLLFSPLAGVVADRYDRRRVMLFADTLAALGTFFALAVLLTGALHPWHLYLSIFLNSTANSFQWPAWEAATGVLVPKEHLGRSGGLNQVGEAVSSLLAPAAAGALYVIFGLRTVFIIDLITFGVALATLVAVRFPRPARTDEAEASRESWTSEMMFGWRYLAARPGLLGLLIVFALGNFFGDFTFTLFTPLMLELTEPETFGLIMSIAGAGMLVGTLVMSAWGGTRRKVVSLALAEMIAAVVGVLIGLTRQIWLIAVLSFLQYAFFPIAQGSSDAIWQRKVAQDAQGRVFAARHMMAFAITPIALLLVGPLSERVFIPLLLPGGALEGTFVGQIVGVGPGRGLGLMFALGNFLMIPTVLAILLHPRIRRLELELPDAIEESSPGEPAAAGESALPV